MTFQGNRVPYSLGICSPPSSCFSQMVLYQSYSFPTLFSDNHSFSLDGLLGEIYNGVVCLCWVHTAPAQNGFNLIASPALPSPSRTRITHSTKQCRKP